jgi:DNA-binding NarL/FixJ family response regulator
MIKTIVTDDHPIVLEGLKNLLSNRDDLELSGFYENGKDLLQALGKVKPDVLLLDINLPDISGLELCKQIRARDKDIKIIALSVHDEHPVINSMLQSGVNGYVLKNSVGTEIIQAIHTVMEGKRYLCGKTQEILNKSGDGQPKQVPRITRREKEILQLIAKGYTTPKVAAELFISTHTVESHRKNLMEKFEVNNMTTVIKLATDYQLL